MLKMKTSITLVIALCALNSTACAASATEAYAQLGARLTSFYKLHRMAYPEPSDPKYNTAKSNHNTVEAIFRLKNRKEIDKWHPGVYPIAYRAWETALQQRWSTEQLGGRFEAACVNQLLQHE